MNPLFICEFVTNQIYNEVIPSSHIFPIRDICLRNEILTNKPYVVVIQCYLTNKIFLGRNIFLHVSIIHWHSCDWTTRQGEDRTGWSSECYRRALEPKRRGKRRNYLTLYTAENRILTLPTYIIFLAIYLCYNNIIH